jgi:Ca-activated chloride channel family protein
MSFREPLLLAGLLLVPLALVAYLLAQRRRRRYAVRYPAVDVLAGVAGRARGRHLPALFALLALAALGIALGRPERTVAVEQRQGTVMLVHDTSGSMQATDVAPNRLAAAREAAGILVRSLPEEFRLGLISFNSKAEQLSEPTTDRAQVQRVLDAIDERGATAMGDGDQRDPHAGDRPRRATAAAARGDSAAVGRREHHGRGSARGRRRCQAVPHPDLRDRAGHPERDAAQEGRDA